jgi:hypothetical protein
LATTGETVDRGILTLTGDGYLSGSIQQIPCQRHVSRAVWLSSLYDVSHCPWHYM